MRSFDEIYAIAADRKGGPDALERLLSTPAAQAELERTPDAAWLATMAKCIFQAGFNWTVIEEKWSGFEDAFDGFVPDRVAFYHDEDVDRLLANKRIVRNGSKIMAVIENARFVQEIASEHGSFGAFVSRWPSEDFIGLLEQFSRRGTRLGGLTGQRALRAMGRDSFLLSQDVAARLIAENVIDKPASSKRALQAVQAAFNTWSHESGRGLTQISQVLAFSV